MAITRLAISNPPANTPTLLGAVNDPYFVSVTVTNRAESANPETKVRIWVQPQTAVSAEEYAYIVYNLTLPYGATFETFRFALNAQDAVYVQTNVGTTSFLMTGLLQADEASPAAYPQTFRNKVIDGNNDNLILFARGPLADRPASAAVGYVRFNTEIDALEVKTANEGWQPVGTGAAGGINIVDGVLRVDAVETNSIYPPDTLVGTYTISSPTTITLDPISEVINTAPMKLVEKTVAQLSTSGASTGSVVYCVDEAGGAQPVFYDGSVWRKFSDRAAIS